MTDGESKIMSPDFLARKMRLEAPHYGQHCCHMASTMPLLSLDSAAMLCRVDSTTMVTWVGPPLSSTGGERSHLYWYANCVAPSIGTDRQIHTPHRLV